MAMLKSAAVLGFALAFAGAAQARCFTGQHNGSEMEVCYKGRNVIIYYSNPRPSLERIGISSGDVVFRGRRSGREVSGIAYVFKYDCPDAGYRVSGRIREGRIGERHEIRLSGLAPLREGRGCRVTDHSWENHNSNLIFVVEGDD